MIINFSLDGEIKLSATDLHSSGFHIVGADLRNLVELEAKLKDSDVRYDAPTFILTECVLVYMQSQFGDALLKFLSDKFKTAVFVNYEQVNKIALLLSNSQYTILNL